ncbi:MAG: hypothetical protein ABFD18_04005, partial [Syntrophomonas sp.]
MISAAKGCYDSTDKTITRKLGLCLLGIISIFILFGLVKIPSANAAGEVWTSIDADATNGLNYSGSQDGQLPSVAVLGGNVYVAWQESNGTTTQIRASKYDKLAGTWSRIDGGGANGLNIDPAKNALSPYLAVFNDELYMVWLEEYTNFNYIIVHARKYSGSGSSWIDIDDRLYGSASYTKDTPCLNFGTNCTAGSPVLAVYNSHLYAAWVETNGSNKQVRVSRYDGDQVWTPVENVDPETNGLNYNTGYDAYTPRLAADSSFLYLAWFENNGTGSNTDLRVKKYNGTSWTTCDGNTPLTTVTTSEQTNLPQLVVHNGDLYLSWHQKTYYSSTYSYYVPQIKLMKYNGSTWSYVTGNDSTNGLNYTLDNDGNNPALTNNNKNLFLIWDEYDNSATNQIRAITYNSTRTFIDGNGIEGINKSTSQGAYKAVAACNDQFLYTAWQEYNGSNNVVRVKHLALPYIASTNPTSLTEAAANDGSLTSGAVVITIANGTLANPLVKADVTAAQLPAGLDYTVTRNSDTQLTVNITGNATSHADANDVSNLTFTIAQAKVTGATSDLTTGNISINFSDPAASIASTNPTSLTEAAANDGSLTSGAVAITIANGTLANPLVKADVTATQLPAGMDYTVTRDSDTHLTVNITGNATSHADANDVINLTFTIAQAKVTGATSDLTTGNISINFSDPAASIASTNPTSLTEA